MALIGLLTACTSPHRTINPQDTASTTNTQVADATQATTDGDSDTGSSTSDETTVNDTSTADTTVTVGDVDTWTTSSDIDAAGAPSDAQPADIAAQATACFVGGPPGPNDKVKSPPKPTGICPKFDTPFVGATGDKLGPATLKIELGALDPTDKQFKPYKEGEFIGIEPGGQPGFHVWLAFRVHLPTETADQIKLEVAARGLIDCDAHGYGSIASYVASKDPTVNNAYTFKHKLNTGFAVICQDTNKCIPSKFCGNWYDLRLQVRQIGTTNWGKGQVLVRIWDGVTKKD